MAAAGTPPDAVACNMAMRACGRAGAWQAALGLLDTCEVAHGVLPTERMRRSAVQACGRAREHERGLQLIQAQGGDASLGMYAAAIDGRTYPQGVEILGRRSRSLVRSVHSHAFTCTRPATRPCTAAA